MSCRQMCGAGWRSACHQQMSSRLGWCAPTGTLRCPATYSCCARASCVARWRPPGAAWVRLVHDASVCVQRGAAFSIGHLAAPHGTTLRPPARSFPSLQVLELSQCRRLQVGQQMCLHLASPPTAAAAAAACCCCTPYCATAEHSAGMFRPQTVAGLGAGWGAPAGHAALRQPARLRGRDGRWHCAAGRPAPPRVPGELIARLAGWSAALSVACTDPHRRRRLRLARHSLPRTHPGSQPRLLHLACWHLAGVAQLCQADRCGAGQAGGAERARAAAALGEAAAHVAWKHELPGR